MAPKSWLARLGPHPQSGQRRAGNSDSAGRRSLHTRRMLNACRRNSIGSMAACRARFVLMSCTSVDSGIMFVPPGKYARKGAKMSEQPWMSAIKLRFMTQVHDRSLFARFLLFASPRT